MLKWLKIKKKEQPLKFGMQEKIDATNRMKEVAMKILNGQGDKRKREIEVEFDRRGMKPA